MEQSQILTEIDKAFGDTVYPGDKMLIDPDLARSDEVNECELKFKGKRWQDVDSSIIAQEQFAAGTTFLSPEAYRYYLPAYMMSIVKDYAKVPAAVGSVVDSLLMPILDESTRRTNSIQDINGRWWRDSSSSSFQERVSGFTDMQCKAIRNFLLYIAETYKNSDANLAVDRYWNKFGN